MGNTLRRLLPCALAISLAACAAGPEFITRPFVPPGRIAVLPFADESGSVEAPDMLRRLAWEALSQGGYDLLPLDLVSERLSAAGIARGEQLGARSPEELARLLNASALYYCTVKKFSYVTLGFYRKREVSLAARMVSYDGTPVWRHSCKEKNSSIHMGRIRKKLATQLAVRSLEMIFSHPLYPEMCAATRKLLMTLPSARDPRIPTGKGFPGG